MRARVWRERESHEPGGFCRPVYYAVLAVLVMLVLNGLIAMDLHQNPLTPLVP